MAGPDDKRPGEEPEENQSEAAPAEDLNSTMMAIDISKLDFDGNTKTDIKIDFATDDEIIQEKLEQKKSPLARIFSKLFSKRPPQSQQGGAAAARARNMSPLLKRFIGVWVADPMATRAQQMFFYASRILIAVVGVYLHFVLLQLFQGSLESEHPARNIFVTVIGSEFVLVLLALLLRFSPGWVVTLPLMALGMIFSGGVVYFHSADLLYFSYNNLPISDVMNPYFAVALGYTGCVSLLLVARHLVMRLIVFVLFALALVPVVLNFYQGVPFELSLHGAGFLADLPSFYLQPTYLLIHGILPLFFFMQAFLSVGTSKVPFKVAGRGFARSHVLLFAVLSLLGVCLLQKNRIFHVGNLVVPYSLDVAASEIEVLNQKLRVETSNFRKHAGNDDKSRYKINLKKGQSEDQYLLQVVDEFNFPVKNLDKSDFEIFIDGKKLAKFKMEEVKDLALSRGSYVLNIKVEPKQQLVTWDDINKIFSDKDKIVFKISDRDKIKHLQVKFEDEVYLDVKDLTVDAYVLPLSYFESGDYKLDVLAFDEFNQSVFEDQFKFTTKIASDLALLSPVQGDTVSDTISVLMFPKGIKHSDIQSVSFKVDEEILYESAESIFYHALDVSSLSDGAHSLTVQVKTAKGTLNRSATFYKASGSSSFSITHPSMGMFALRNTEVKYQLDAAAKGKIAGIKVYVNGNLFEDYIVKDNAFSLPAPRWGQSELFVSVQASLEDGTKVSDWVQVNKGLAELEIKFDIKSLGFINFENIGFVFDATVSHLDHWQGKEKWYWVKRLIADTDVLDRIKTLSPHVIVFGQGKPYYYQACDDFDVVVSPKKFNPATVKKSMNQIRPAGISSLLASLKKSYSYKPQKIFVVTDSRDGCKTSMKKDITKLQSQSPATQVVVFVLGQPSKKDADGLQELAQITGGKFYQPQNYENLVETLLKELELSYELHSSNEMIFKEPLGKKKTKLASGNYKLKIPYGSETKEVDFNLENGTRTQIEITGKDNTVHVKVSESRL